MNCNRYIYAEDCPVCGQKDELEKYLGARRGSSSWGHMVSACSRKCGKRYAIWLQLGKATIESEFGHDSDQILVSVGSSDYGQVLRLSKSKISLRNEIKRLRSLVNNK